MNYSATINLQKPLGNERYNIAVANSNVDILDSEINKLKLKNDSQDNLIAESDSTIVTNDDIDQIFE